MSVRSWGMSTPLPIHHEPCLQLPAGGNSAPFAIRVPTFGSFGSRGLAQAGSGLGARMFHSLNICWLAQVLQLALNPHLQGSFCQGAEQPPSLLGIKGLVGLGHWLPGPQDHPWASWPRALCTQGYHSRGKMLPARCGKYSRCHQGVLRAKPVRSGLPSCQGNRIESHGTGTLDLRAPVPLNQLGQGKLFPNKAEPHCPCIRRGLQAHRGLCMFNPPALGRENCVRLKPSSE